MSEKEIAFKEFCFGICIDIKNDDQGSVQLCRIMFDTGFDAGIKAERARLKKELLELANNYIGDVLVEHFEELFPDKDKE